MFTSSVAGRPGSYIPSAYFKKTVVKQQRPGADNLENSYETKTTDLQARQRYNDAKYYSDPTVVAKRDAMRNSMLQRELDDEAFTAKTAPTARTISDYGLKTDELMAKQAYDDAQFSADPERVRRRKALEDSRMALRESMIGRMRSKFGVSA